MEIFKLFLLFCAVFLANSGNTTGCNLELKSQFTSSTLCGDAVITTNSPFVCDDNVTFTLESSMNLFGYELCSVELNFEEIPSVVSVYLNGNLFSLFSNSCVVTDPSCQPLPKGNALEIDLMDIDESLETLQFEMSNFESSSQYTAPNVSVLAALSEGFFLPGPHYFLVEGEDGVLPTGLSPPVAYDSFPTSGRGYAALDYEHSDNGEISYIIMIPKTSTYRVVAHFENQQLGSSIMDGSVIQGADSYPVRIIYTGKFICDSDCFVEGVVNSSNSVQLKQGLASLIFTGLTHINISLDYIASVPEVFYSTSSCGDVTSTPNPSGVCEEALLQLSAEFFNPRACGCNPQCSTSSMCARLGGQCECISAAAATGLVDPIGRTCSLCPFYYYKTSQGCEECGCPDGSLCELADGQCPCSNPLVGGRTCNECMDGNWGNVDEGCKPCSCDVTGSINNICDKSTGECSCRDNIGGNDCSACVSGAYNFSSSGCESCNCSQPGSVVLDCDKNGDCLCQDGFTDSKCDVCDTGYYQFGTSCFPCNCSGQTSDCHQNLTSSIPHEVCNCPQEYSGDSCQFCSELHYQSGGECVPCECNETAFACNNTTGECLIFPPPPPPPHPSPPPPPLNCTPNLTGDQCDMCAEGYYNASLSEEDLLCKLCPCDLNTSISTNCTVDEEGGGPICQCLPGHEGLLCDSCSPGYFGIPPLYPCSTCDCSGNINASDPEACNRTTGECIECLYNTEGPQCSTCTDGFFGNASIPNNCQPCSCDPVGSQSPVCDKSSGECSCLAGVGGVDCSQCEPGYWNLSAGIGCSPCSCHPDGSQPGVTECDTVSGQCSCKMGIGGRECNECLPSYFKFSAQGCQECMCSIGAVNDSCDQDTGKCFCQEGATGDKCEICLPYYLTTPTGCKKCSDCIFELVDWNDSLNNTLDDIDVLYLDAFAKLQADTCDLNEIKGDILLLNVTIEKFLEDNVTIDIVDDLNATYTLLVINLDLLEELLMETLEGTEALSPNIENLFDDIRILHNNLEIEFYSADETFFFVYHLQAEFLTLETNASLLFTSINTTVDSLLQQNLSEVLSMANNILSMITASHYNISSLLEQHEAEKTYVIYLQNTSMPFHALFLLRQAEIENIIASLQNLNHRLIIAGNEIDNLTILASSLNSSADSSSMMLDLAHGNNSAVRETLEWVLGNISLLQELVEGETGLQQDDSSGVDMSFWNLSTSFQQLFEDTKHLQQQLNGSLPAIDEALVHADVIIDQSEYICNVLGPSLAYDDKAVQTILNFTQIRDVVNQALELMEEANMTLKTVTTMVEDLTEKNFSARANTSVTEVEDAFNTTLQLNFTINDHLSQYQSVLTDIPALNMLVKTILNNASDVVDPVSHLTVTSDMTCSNIDAILFYVSHSTNQTQTLYYSMKERYQELEDQVDNTTEELLPIPGIVQQIESDLNAANTSILFAEENISERMEILSNISYYRNLTQTQLSAAESSHQSLRNQLRSAREAAASIDIALRFQGNASVQFSSHSVDTSSVDKHISLLFKPDAVGGVLLSSGDAILSMNSNSSIEWSDSEVAVSTKLLNLTSETWYHVLASSEGSSRSISVAQLQQSGVLASESVVADAGVNSTSLSPTIFLAGPEEEEDSEEDYFTGCIDKVVINKIQLPLLLPDNESISTCGPRPAADPERSIEEGVWFMGGGYLKLEPMNFNGSLSFSLRFRTFSTNNVEILWASNELSEVTLSLTGAQVIALLDEGNPPLACPTILSYGQWHSISMEINSSVIMLTLDGEMCPPLASWPFFSGNYELFLGGHPSSLPSVGMFAGCMSDVVFQSVPANLTSAQSNGHVDTSGCPALVEPGVHFMGTGAAAFLVSDNQLVTEVSLSFRTSQLAAILLHMASCEEDPPSMIDHLTLSIYHSHVRVDSANFLTHASLISDQANLNDGEWHFINLAFGSTRLFLTVDGETVDCMFPSLGGWQILAHGNITVGGAGSSCVGLENLFSPTAENFRGCMQNITINGTSGFYDIRNADSLEGVALYGCHGSEPTLPPVGSGIPEPSFVPPTTSSISVSETTSILSATPIPTTSSSSLANQSSVSGMLTPSMAISATDVQPSLSSQFITNQSSVSGVLTPSMLISATDIQPSLSSRFITNQSSVSGMLTPSMAISATDIQPSLSSRFITNQSSVSGMLTPSMAISATDIQPSLSSQFITDGGISTTHISVVSVTETPPTSGTTLMVTITAPVTSSSTLYTTTLEAPPTSDVPVISSLGSVSSFFGTTFIIKTTGIIATEPTPVHTVFSETSINDIHLSSTSIVPNTSFYTSTSDSLLTSFASDAPVTDTSSHFSFFSDVPLTSSTPLPFTFSTTVVTESMPIITSSETSPVVSVGVSSSPPQVTPSTVMPTSSGALSMSVVSSSVPLTSPTPIFFPFGVDGEVGSFLAYSLMHQDLVASFNITLTFQTVTATSLLLYLQGFVNPDFTALEIVNGVLVYSFDVGGGSNPIASSSGIRYDDGITHTVILLRNGNSGTMIADGDEFTADTAFSHADLNADGSPLYVGGAPPGLPLASSIMPVQSGALACFYSLYINNQPINLRDPLVMQGGEECSDVYSNVASFDNGYAQILDFYRPGPEFTFMIEFRTYDCNGILLYNAHPDNQDHVALELKSGLVRFVVDNGIGATIATYAPSDNDSLCDGNWHSIAASKSGITISLEVDDGLSIDTLISNVMFLSVDAFSPLFIAGVPDEVALQLKPTITNDPLKGCFGMVQVTQGGELISLSFAGSSDSMNMELYVCSIMT